MTNLFKRINDMISANINDLIDRVEDPERMVKQINHYIVGTFANSACCRYRRGHTLS